MSAAKPVTFSPKEEEVEAITLTVESLGAQGDGIAEHAGEPVFLPFAVPGDVVRAELGVRRGGGREGRIVERLVAGTGRVEPVCPHFGQCGGCALQHLGPDAYRAVKLGALHAALRRVGLNPGVVQPLRTPDPARRRAALGLVRPATGPAIIGFRERFRPRIVDMRECAVLEPRLLALVDPLRREAASLLAPGAVAEIMLTGTDSGVDMLVRAGEQPGLAALEALARLAAEHDIARIVWRCRGEAIPIAEHRPPRVMLSGVAVPFPPGGFLQASVAAEAILVAEVTAAIGDARPALDLYAGLGTFALALARAGAVHAVEGDAEAVAALSRAAPPSLTVEHRNIERDPLAGDALLPYAAAVFDPPRSGAARQAAALAASRLATIVAVSCNPATFARDAAVLTGGGYRLERVVPVDQFAWTPHLELVAVFRR